MTGYTVDSVIIVGGGSAGWLTALVLTTYCPFLKIKLIRPSINKTIGVGESTQTDLPQRLTAAGINVESFYSACDATIKCGIFYRDWNEIGDHYWHPFTDMADKSGYTPAHHFQQMILREPNKYRYEDYYSAVHTSYDTCVNKNQVAPEAAIALHIDAAKAAVYLEKHLPSVELLESHKIEVVSEGESVTCLKLDGREERADLYVDCTGFAKALIGRVGSCEILPYEANVNRAVAASVPYADMKVEMHPYTRAHAHEYGWTWSIPLQTRIGSGYVYHGDFCSKDEAEMNFRQYWGLDRMRDVEVNHISFDSKTLRKPWEGNVVAVGLSAGFIEPLEATGLNWTISSADLVSNFLGGRYVDQDLRDKYNSIMLGYIHDVQDFVDAHYKLSSRRDTEFWKYLSSRAYPERLESRLALYSREMPSAKNRVKSYAWAFNEVSWMDILNGYKFRYDTVHASEKEKEWAIKELKEIAESRENGLDPRTLKSVVI